ncbi:MAG: hypothetical protein JW888_13895, partial [Pirellulales bacterium]|nr:hypothetical protein [Pirellulales bacterium]
GVSVENEEGQAEVHVFQGEVELRSAKDGNQKDATPQRLAAGRVVRVEPSSSRGQMVIRNIATSTNQFVRRLPIASEASKPTVDDKRSRPTVVADFSGGNGSSEVDQFPGVPGLGWATDWELGEIEEVDSIASIENTNPVLGGGDYLRVLATRRFGTDHVRRCVCRRLDLNSPVDLKKRHVVFFDVRLDVMDSVDDPRDAITICSNSKRGRELDNDLSAGWHIRAKGPRQGQGQASARDWHFSTSNGRGRVRDFGSDVAVCQGKTYSFRILVDPEARTWTPSIAVDGGRFKKFGAMGMRSSGTAEIRGYWPYLHFRWEMAGGNKGNRLERIGFSVDSIRIVPADQAGLADSGDYRDKDNAKSPRAL